MCHSNIFVFLQTVSLQEKAAQISKQNPQFRSETLIQISGK